MFGDRRRVGGGGNNAVAEAIPSDADADRDVDAAICQFDAMFSNAKLLQKKIILQNFALDILALQQF